MEQKARLLFREAVVVCDKLYAQLCRFAQSIENIVKTPRLRIFGHEQKLKELRLLK